VLCNVTHCKWAFLQQYSPLSAAASAMKDQGVTRVLLGASSLLSNGAMLGPAGTAMVAALAKARQIPVIVAAESYKFSEKVQLDSIVYNELGQTSEIAVMATPAAGTEGDSGAGPVPQAQRQPGYRGSAPPLTASGAEQSGPGADADPIALPSTWRAGEGVSNAPLPFNVVNLRYDLTPIGNISVVATETGLTPPTSIPVLMREMVQTDMLHPAGRPGAPAPSKAAPLATLQAAPAGVLASLSAAAAAGGVGGTAAVMGAAGQGAVAQGAGVVA
jgi:translation initiation factor 2B subunit (eIF-2B alpha/beta/delta family)